MRASRRELNAKVLELFFVTIGDAPFQLNYLVDIKLVNLIKRTLLFLQKFLCLFVNDQLYLAIFNISDILHHEFLDVLGIHYFPRVAGLRKVHFIMVLTSVEVVLVLWVANPIVAFYCEKNVENLDEVPTWH